LRETATDPSVPGVVWGMGLCALTGALVGFALGLVVGTVW
jgi:hypothetical protein